MKRPITLVSGQWADLGLEGVADIAAELGYDGLELALKPAFIDIGMAASDSSYRSSILEGLAKKGLKLWALSTHAIGKCVADWADPRLDAFAPPRCKGKPESRREWAVDAMLKVPGIARGLGCTVVTTFMGSPIWPFVYGFPPTSEALIDEGYGRAAELWTPILDEFASVGVSLALEPHPSELAFDWYSTERLVKALNGHSAFGLNVDPSHLFWQGVDPADFVRAFAPLVRHVHMKDLALRPDGRRGILGSHLPFGDSRRAWNFRSVGRGDIDFEELLRALDEIGYAGPLSVEWEDNAMDRVEGAAESLSAVRALQRSSPLASFDSQTASYPQT